MTPGEVFWFIVGLPTGVLVLMSVEVAQSWWVRSRAMHPMQFTMRFPPPTPPPTTGGWDEAFDQELLPQFTPTPRAVTPAPSVLMSCPICGRGPFKRLAQHQAMAHRGVPR